MGIIQLFINTCIKKHKGLPAHSWLDPKSFPSKTSDSGSSSYCDSCHSHIPTLPPKMSGQLEIGNYTSNKQLSCKEQYTYLKRVKPDLSCNSEMQMLSTLQPVAKGIFICTLLVDCFSFTMGIYFLNGSCTETMNQHVKIM